MIKIASKLKVYLYSALILTGVAIILCTLSYIFAFDANVGYFSSTSPLPYILTSLISISAVFFFSSVLFLPKGATEGDTPITISVNIASIPAAMFSALLGAVMIAAYFTIAPSNVFGKLFPSFLSGSIGVLPTSAILLLAGIFLAISAIYFVMTWTVQKESAEKHALFGFALPIASLFLIAAMYFDHYVTMNSPVKLALQTALLSFMLFSLFELRVPLKKAKPRAYFFFGMLTVLFTGIASIPQIIAFAAGILKNPSYFIYAIFTLGIFVYVIARLCIFVFARNLHERIADQTPEEFELEPLTDGADAEGSEESESEAESEVKPEEACESEAPANEDEQGEE